MVEVEEAQATQPWQAMLEELQAAWVLAALGLASLEPTQALTQEAWCPPTLLQDLDFQTASRRP